MSTSKRDGERLISILKTGLCLQFSPRFKLPNRVNYKHEAIYVSYNTVVYLILVPISEDYLNQKYS